MNKKPSISLSRQEKNGPAVTLSVISEKKTNQKILPGILTSRIEKKVQNSQTYYYGFFGIEGYEFEVPVVFKTKPNLEKGSQVELIGNWANSQQDRPSFTCLDYKLLKEPEPPTLLSLEKEISLLLKPSLDKKKDWSETIDFLFRKKKELAELEKMSQLGEYYLKAYLLTRQVFYANYQSEHLAQADFTLPSYLHRVASELEIAKRQMISAGWKESKNA